MRYHYFLVNLPLALPLVESIEAVRCFTGGVDLLDKEKSLASGSTGLITR